MPIFPVLETEELVQEKDKTRLDAIKSYVSSDLKITKIEICPAYTGTGDTFYDCTQDGFLDWAFTHSGTPDPQIQTIAARITDDATPTPGTALVTKTIKVVTELKDHLFSTDGALRQHESDVLKFVPAGRATFKDVHRLAQTKIIDWLDTQGYVDYFEKKYTIESLIDIDEVRPWATALTLQLIFESIRKTDEDEYAQKSKKYERDVEFYRNRAIIRIDKDRSGSLAIGEQIDVRSCTVMRR